MSIDSFDPHEVEAAVAAGAELVLSVNGSNVSAALRGVARSSSLPDVPRHLDGLDQTIERLQAWG